MFQLSWYGLEVLLKASLSGINGVLSQISQDLSPDLRLGVGRNPGVRKISKVELHKVLSVITTHTIGLWVLA